MYISKNQHILSKSISLAAFLNIGAAGAAGLLRFLVTRTGIVGPDMLNNTIWAGQILISVLKIILISVGFYFAWKKLVHFESILPMDDALDMAKLQEEMLGDSIGTLPMLAISQLLQVWAVVMIGAEIVYVFTSEIYRKFIAQIAVLIDMNNQAAAGLFTAAYNNSHGFKYIGMFIAIILGVFVTGIFLKDKLLKIVAIGITAVFLFTFMILQMHTFTIFSRSIGIVWTSVIFHLAQTIGLNLLAIYLAKRYKGL